MLYLSAAEEHAILFLVRLFFQKKQAKPQDLDNL